MPSPADEKKIGWQCAQAALFTPFIAGCLSWYVSGRSVPDDAARSTGMALVYLGWGMIAFGILAGAFALTRIPKEGAKGILVRAIIGLTLNLALASTIVYFLFGKPPPRTGAPLGNAEAWIKFAPPGGGLSVLLPGNPTRNTTVKHGFGINLADGTWFAIDWNDLPGLEGAAKVEEFLIAATDDFKSQAKKNQAFAMSRNGFQGRESTWTRPDGAAIRREMIVARGRSYTVMSSVPASRAAARAADVKQFFDSVVITGPDKAGG